MLCEGQRYPYQDVFGNSLGTKQAACLDATLSQSSRLESIIQCHDEMVLCCTMTIILDLSLKNRKRLWTIADLDLAAATHGIIVGTACQLNPTKLRLDH